MIHTHQSAGLLLKIICVIISQGLLSLLAGDLGLVLWANIHISKSHSVASAVNAFRRVHSGCMKNPIVRLEMTERQDVRFDLQNCCY